MKTPRPSMLVASLGLLACITAGGTGCVSRVQDHDGEHVALWEFEPEVLVKNRNRTKGKRIFRRYLRAGGRVECSGWLFKKQTTHTYARTTDGPGGREMISPRISTRAVYLDGVFKDVAMSNTARMAASVETYETVNFGFNPGFVCSCVYVTATVPVITGRTLLMVGKVCPDEE